MDYERLTATICMHINKFAGRSMLFIDEIHVIIINQLVIFLHVDLKQWLSGW